MNKDTSPIETKIKYFQASFQALRGNRQGALP
jgi:hypothetical protein